MTTFFFALDQVVAEAKSAEITKQQDQILQTNPTAADLSEIKNINDKRVPDHRRGRHKFKNGKNGKDDYRSKRNVKKLFTNVELSQATLVVVAQLKMSLAVHVGRKAISQKFANLPNEFKVLTKAPVKMTSP